MADGARLNNSTAEVSREIAKDTCPVQSTLGQMHETELSEAVHQIESEIGGNKQEKINVAVSSIVNEQQPFSEIAGKTSLPEQFRLPPEDVRKSSQSENGSCQQVTTLEQTHELDSGHVCTKLLEEHLPGIEQTNEVAPEDIGTEPSEQHQSGSDHEPVQTIAAVSSSIIGNNLDSPSASVTVNSLNNEVELPWKDVSMSCQTGNSSCTQHAILEQIYECGAGSTCNELSDQKHHLGSDILQNELDGTNSVSYSAVNKKLEVISENEILEPNKQLAVPPEDVSKNCQSLRSSCPQETTSEPNFDSGGVHSVPPEQCSSVNVRKSSESEKGSCQQVTTLEQTHELDSVNVCTKLLEEHLPGFEQTNEVAPEDIGTEPSEQHQSGSDHEPNEPVQTIAALSSSIIGNNLDLPSASVTVNSLSHEVELPQGDVSMSNQTGNSSCTQHTILEQIYECGAGSTCNELSEQKHHFGSDLLQSELDGTNTAVPYSAVNKKLEVILENENSRSDEQLAVPPEDVSKNCQSVRSSCPQETASEHNCDSGVVHSMPPEQKDELISVNVQYVPVETRTAVSDSIVTEHFGLSLVAMTESSPVGHLELPLGVIKGPNDKQLDPSSEDVTKKSSLEQTPPKIVKKNSGRLGNKDKRTTKSRKKKYMLRSLVGNDRVLRSSTREKPKALESSTNLGNDCNGGKKDRKKRKRGRKRVTIDEFSRIRTRLRYLLYRIGYEQNLIDAYSGEGWKGYSIEKLKPEKELQRATSEILSRKVKIRDLFQRLDSLCAEGRFPNSLFDSEGLIDSEDIFCAKCGSKDLSAGNDIILCDGACDRGFHQFCLEPPLLSEDIPPGDEGWLCPGCDCKIDCIDLLNDSQGTDLSIVDSWEKVFPEAAMAAEGKGHNLELPSDESDDDDYDPEGPGTDENIQGDESSPDHSEYASASEELEAPANDEQHLGLPSDDSEDDDYNPDGPDLEKNVKQESSSSDFTSDSEDLAAALDDYGSSENVGPMSSSLDSKRTASECDEQSSTHFGKLSSLKKELLSIQDGSPPVSRTRQIERLDYKKLHDDAYGNVSSDESSDDEDWTDTAAPRKRNKSGGQVPLESASKNASITKNVSIIEVINYDLKVNNHIPKRRSSRNSKVENTNDLPSKSLEGSSKSVSSRGRSRPSSHRRLGEAVTERLYSSFKENQYPDRATKESLAQELGLTSQQVSKWFENARWSFRHPAPVEAGRSASDTGISLPRTNVIQAKSEQNTTIRKTTRNGAQNKKLPGTCDSKQDWCGGDGKVVIEESNGQNSTPRNTKKRKGRSDLDSRTETPKPSAVVETRESGQRTNRRRRKSFT
ncbi:hypothetical protein FNV43_RR22598 [Rhamnella rubrinervis]|uniref:Homeobox protein HAT3.1 n=1 Tax=Rhamnella rubrinervis TaxID=2594499 RepID=A0A8K0DWH6_9ROSA|nr:hypothetical protein FNV43_RR22598 [Rhamnella rubrinervis]